MATSLTNGTPKLDTFKAGVAKDYSFALPARSFVQLKTSTTDTADANSTISCEGSDKTARSQINILSLTLPAGSHGFTVTSDKDARFAVNFVAVAQSRFDAFKSFFRF